MDGREPVALRSREALPKRHNLWLTVCRVEAQAIGSYRVRRRKDSESEALRLVAELAAVVRVLLEDDR